MIVLVLGGAIAFLALRSSPYLQYVPWMPRRIGVWADSNGIVRNIAAFFVFALAVFLLVGRRAGHVAVLCLFATAIEMAQLGIKGRVFDWRDILASMGGIILAWPIVAIVRGSSAS